MYSSLFLEHITCSALEMWLHLLLMMICSIEKYSLFFSIPGMFHFWVFLLCSFFWYAFLSFIYSYHWHANTYHPLQKLPCACEVSATETSNYWVISGRFIYSYHSSLTCKHISSTTSNYWRISARAASVYREIHARRKQFQVREFPVCTMHEWAEISFWHE